MAEGVPRLEFKGLGPFIRYGDIQAALRRSRRVTVSIDLDAEPLLETWARKHLIKVQKMSEGIYLLAFEEASLEKPAARLEIPDYIPQDLARLVPSPTITKWRRDLSEKLADPAQLLGLVLRAQTLYRGPARGEEFEDLLRREDPVLLKATIDGNDVVLVIRHGDVIAGARINNALTETEAKAILQRVLREGLSVTIYDVAALI